ncbi:MAG: MBG domain-containing protein [Cyclobacteriaceae bacterium]
MISVIRNIRLHLIFLICCCAGYAHAQISYLEYYIDVDPGYGNATSIPLTSSDSVTVDFNVPLDAVSLGIHLLVTRARDAEGTWSPDHQQVFFNATTPVVVDLIKAEYFIDDDPGYGNGLALNFNAAKDVQIDQNIDVSQLSAGIHMMHSRAQNSLGYWSTNHQSVFLVIPNTITPNLKAFEYYIDEDPGFGKGIPLTGSTSDSAIIATNIDLSGLPNGIHQFCIRAQNDLGNWSQVSLQTFLVIASNERSPIVAAEYYFDEDPGFGNGSQIAVTPGDSVLIDTSVDLSGLTEGIHQLGIRAKAASGAWSQISTGVFLAIASEEIAQIAQVEYYFGEDPGLGLATQVSVGTADSVNVSEVIDLSSFNLGDTIQFAIRAKDNLGRWSTTYTHEVVIRVLENQTITFTFLANKTYGDSKFTLEATSDAGLDVAYESSDEEIVSIVGKEVTIVNAGTATITASQAGDQDYYPAEPITQSLTIDPATLTVTAEDKSKVYSEPNPELTIAYNGFVNGENVANITEPTIATLAEQTSGAGTYDITLIGGAADNYTLNKVNGKLIVNKAVLSVVADDKTRVYGTEDPVFTQTISGFVNNETESVLTTDPVVASEATVASGVGNYAINSSGGLADNYSFSYTPGSLVVTKAALTAAADNQTKAYGQANPALTTSYTGFVNGDDETGITLPLIATSADETSSVGNYDITLSGGSAANYELSLENGSLAVTKAALIAQADNLQKVYGDTNPALTTSYTGFVNGDNETGITVPQITTLADETSSVGNYDITLSGGSATNYELSLVNGSLSVTKAVLTAQADNLQKVYGDANPALTTSYTGFVNGDNETGITVPQIATSADETSSVGNYDITLSGGSATNYELSLENGSLEVTKATLTAIADNQTKVYGEANPALTASYEGFVNGDNVSAITTPLLATVANEISDVGNYNITLSGGEAPNYDFAFVNGRLSVTKANLVVTPEDLTIKQGEELTFTATYSGFVNGDTENDLDTTPELSSEATSASPVGNYGILASGGEDNNYDFTYEAGVLTIEMILGTDPMTFEIEVFPNPAIKDVMIQTEEKWPVVISDMNGKELISAFSNEKIDITNLSQGVYLIQIQEQTSKLIVN